MQTLGLLGTPLCIVFNHMSYYKVINLFGTSLQSQKCSPQVYIIFRTLVMAIHCKFIIIIIMPGTIAQSEF